MELSKKCQRMMVANALSAAREDQRYKPWLGLADADGLARSCIKAVGFAFPFAATLAAYHPLQGTAALTVLGGLALLCYRVATAYSSMVGYLQGEQVWKSLLIKARTQNGSLTCRDAVALAELTVQARAEDVDLAQSLIP